MMPADLQLVRALYQAALERPVSERAAFVAAHTAGDTRLRESVERLLSQHAATDVGSPATHADETAELAPGTVVGHYRIDTVLGRGGIGIVYRAADVRLHRPVAIKFLSSSLADATARRRFVQEAESASALNHPHILTVHDVGEHDGRHYIVSELVDGGTLDDWLADERRTWRQGAELLTGVADAIAAAHAAGVLHRDIKPGNILIGANGYAKLADFGLAKLLEPGSERPRSPLDTGVGVVAGTVAYMSPEQATGRLLDARSDVFSFGIVLYEAFAGRRPFHAHTELELLTAIVQGTPAPLPAEIPELLRNVVERALEKDPGDRHQSMRELVIELRRAIRKSTATVYGDGAVVTVQRTRRAPPWVGAAGVAATTALAVAALLVWRAPAERSAARFELGSYQVTQLTTTGNASAPALSPDGRSIAYSQLSRESSTGLFMRRIATQSNVPLVPAESGVLLFGPTITANGEFVDYLSRRTGEAGGPTLWRVPLLGGTPRVLLREVWSPVGHSPDGRQMAFVRYDRETSVSSLVVAGVGGGNERVLVTRTLPLGLLSVAISGSGGQAGPAWSPDGRRIAVFEFGNGDSGAPMHVLFVDPASGAEARQTLGTMPPPLGLGWLGPDALVLSYAEGSGARVQLRRLAYPGGAVAPITNDLLNYVGVDVDAAGTSFVTAREESRHTLWVLDAAGTNPAEVVPPAPHPGGRVSVWWAGGRVFYHTTLDERPALAAVAPGGGPPEIIAEVSGAATTTDGNTLVYEGDGGLWRKEGPRDAVPMGIGEAGEPHITPDDRNVVFLSVRNGVQSPWIVPLAGGEPREIVRALAGDGTLDISPDGTRILFVSIGEQRQVVVMICSLPACAERRELVAPFLGLRSAAPRWMPNGREIAYVDASGANLAVVSLDGTSVGPLTSFADGDSSRVISGFAWSRDGERLALLRESQTNDIVLFRASD